VLYRPMVDSMRALSSASPTLPMEASMPSASRCAVNAKDVYWACFASDFLNHSILKIPSHGSACLTDLEAVDVVQSWREGAGQGAAAVVAEREVRDLRAGPDGAGHPAGGRGPGRGGPVDGGAYLPGGQAGGVGRAGRVGAGPAGCIHTGRRVGGCAGGDRTAAGHGDRAGRGAASARGKIRRGLTAGRVPQRVSAEVKAGLLDRVEHATARGWSARRACGLLRLDHARYHHW